MGENTTMKYKKSIIMLVLVIFIFGAASVCASDVNDTAIVSEDTNQIGLSDNNKIIGDNRQTSGEKLGLSVDDESLSAQTDTNVLSDSPATYSDLAREINAPGTVILKNKNYTYDDGAPAITISEANKVIDGNGAIIDMTGSTIRAFTVSASGVTIKNLTIKNANYNDGDGGAIYFSSSGTVTNCNFTNNTARNGGAINMGSGTVTNCNFTDNEADFGGAVHFEKNGTVTNCNFNNNKANNCGGGGAVYFSEDGTVTNCNFVGNNATYSGGAVYFTYAGTVENCNFTDNSASEEGGAIYSFYWSTADTCIFKTSSDTTFNIGIFPPKLNVDNFTTFYGSGEKLTFNLTTDSGIPVNNGNISISVYFKDNNSWVGNYSCLSGEGWAVSLPVGSYYANFTTEYAGFQAINRTITINKAKTELTAKAITATHNSNKKLIISLKDVNGKPLSGLKLTVKIKSDKTYTTDANGQIKINVANLVPNTYAVKITFNGDANYDMSSKDVKVTVTKATPKLTAKAKSFKKSVKTKKYTVTLKDNNGKAMKKVKLTLKVKGKTYKAKTNSKGKATFKIKKLTKKGTYKAKVKFAGNAYYNAVTKTVKIKIK